MAGPVSTTRPTNSGFTSRSDAALSLALLAVLLLLLVPLPSALLDMLLVLNLGTSFVLLLITLSAKKPLDLAVFPSLLLLLTLYRLSLNVATTRLILLDGDAGRVVSTFGNFVVGGNLVVGLVIFLILIVIQFIVITKGATRISEVNARFVLDAMPGKQMAIDAELNSQAIDEAEARRRRELLTSEAEFYGAMDGAGKFVRGDAIAGLIVTGVNLLGGVVLGVSNGLSLVDALHQYSVLTVGDGLVSQIPALIIAVTAGILVTKNTSDDSLGTEIGSQLLANKSPLLSGAALLVVISFAPGLPKLPFWLMAAGLTLVVRNAGKAEAEAPAEEPAEEDPTAVREDEHIRTFASSDPVCVEIGARLIPLAMATNADGITKRITSLRRDLAQKHGIWIPSIRVRDDIRLPPSRYRILINGRETAHADLDPERLLAINPGSVSLDLEGEKTRDPAFGLEAVWVNHADQARAEMGGYTVVDPVSVLITHLGEELRRYASELLSRDDLKKMLDQLRETAPALVDELKAETIRTGLLHQVLVRLLQERVPITNLFRILESVLNHADRFKDAVQLTEAVREDMARDICDRFRQDDGSVRVVVLDPRLEAMLREKVVDGRLALSPGELERLINDLSAAWQKSSLEAGGDVALLCDRSLRLLLRQSIERALPELGVLAYTEIPKEVRIEPVDVIRPPSDAGAGQMGQSEVFPEAGAA